MRIAIYRSHTTLNANLVLVGHPLHKADAIGQGLAAGGGRGGGGGQPERPRTRLLCLPHPLLPLRVFAAQRVESLQEEGEEQEQEEEEEQQHGQSTKRCVCRMI